MLEAGLGEFSVEFQTGGVVREVTGGTGAQPGGEAAFLGDGREGIIGVTGAEREFLPAMLPAKFFDEKFTEIAGLQERAGTLDVKCHRSVFPYAE